MYCPWTRIAARRFALIGPRAPEGAPFALRCAVAGRLASDTTCVPPISASGANAALSSDKDLSNGMRQRVAIARVLALDSPILLMDEPFGALDALTRRNLQDEVLRIWMKFRKTILFVTHGIEESIYLADRVVVMTYRPGTVKTIVPITLPRPRDTASPEFNALKRHLTGLVMEEQRRHEEDEIRKA